jgi:hypothetical protein
MINKRIWLGISVLVLVFGMAVVGCSSTKNQKKSMLVLEEELEYDMRIRAIELAQARYRNSDLEKINRIDSISQTDGDIRYLTNTYKVTMRGNILGIISNEVEVVVYGEINIRKYNIKVLEARIQ